MQYMKGGKNMSEEQKKNVEQAITAYQERYKGCVFIPTIGELIAEGLLDSEYRLQ